MDYGDAVVTRQADGTLRVDRADPVVGISIELLAQSDGAAMSIDSDGYVWLAGDPAYRYRPVRFAPGLGGTPRIVVCERVTA